MRIVPEPRLARAFAATIVAQIGGAFVLQSGKVGIAMAAKAEPDAGYRKSTPEMPGEFFREFALMALVFVPLEFFLQAPQSYRWHVMIAAIVLSGLFLAGGIIIKRTRAS